MAPQAVKKFYRWFYLYPICVLLLAACGGERAEDALQVQVVAVGEESRELFWFGVIRKEVEVRGQEGSWVLPWEEGVWHNEPLREGDTLQFRGFDEAGRLLVVGEVVIGPEKRISIPIRRLL